MADIYSQAKTMNLNEPVDQARANRDRLATLFGSQRTDTSDYMNRFSGAIAGQEKYADMSARLGGELNIPTLRKNAQMVNTTMNNLPSTYSAATRGFDVNANQLARIIGQKSSELAPAVSTANSALSSAEGELSSRMGLEQAQQQKELMPYQAEQSFLSDRMARETTGYTNQMQSELDSIISKIQNGVTLSEGERQRANQLAQAELSYKAAIKTAEIQQATSKYSSDNQLKGTRLTALSNLANSF